MEQLKAVVVGIFEDLATDTYKKLDRDLGGVLEKFVRANPRSKEFKVLTMIPHVDFEGSQVAYIIGLGKEADYTLRRHREVVAHVAKSVKFESKVLLDSFGKMPLEDKHASTAQEAVILAQYERPDFTSENDDKKPMAKIELVSQADFSAALEKGKIRAEATNVARDLTNLPGNKLNSTQLAKTVSDFAAEHGLEYQIIEKDEMKKRNMGGLLGVNRGSNEPPKMIVAKYKGKPSSSELVALVGKGIMFDTGGYNLKTGNYMADMYGDMGGAASVFGAFMAIALQKLPVNVVLVIPSTDNVVSAGAMKPGDVLHMMNGMTVEVNNTDAEGRLILADALALANELGATKIIDAATLTGAIVRAIGTEITGSFTNDRKFIQEFNAAAAAADEHIWELPIFKEHEKIVRDTPVADLDNAPTRGPGAITAAAFLKEFVGNTPWIHLDIAGTSYAAKPHALGPKGATGVMVRTITKYCETL